MNCNATRESFSDLIDRTLSEADRAEVERHVAQCAPCRAELDDFRRTIAAVAALPRRSAPRNFAAGVMAKIKAEGAAAAATPAAPATKRGVLLRMSRYQGLIQLVSGAAAVFLVYMGVSVFTGGPGTAPSGKPGPVAKGTNENRKVREADGPARSKATETWESAGEKERVLDGLARAPLEGGAPADSYKKGTGANEAGGLEAKDKNALRPDAPADAAPATAGPAKSNIAFQHITVFSSDVPVDSRSVRQVLTDSGYNFTAGEKSNVLIVRVPAKDATRLVAALGDSGAEFRMGGRKGADEVLRRQRESEKLTAGKNGEDATDRDEVVAGARELEKALRSLDELDDNIEQAKAKTAKREADRKNQVAQGEGKRAGGLTAGATDGAPAKEPRDAKHDQGQEERAVPPGAERGESLGAAPGAPENTPPADKPAPASDPAGKPGGLRNDGKHNKDGEHNEEESEGQFAGGGSGGARLKGDGSKELADDERDLAEVEKESEQKIEEALKKLEKAGAVEEECVFLVIEFEAAPEPAKQESK